MYGFSPPYKFRSVKELVEHHTRVSLAQYNNDLDICLQFPATRTVDVSDSRFETDATFPNHYAPSQVNMDDLYKKLHEVHSKVVENTNLLSDIQTKCNAGQQVNSTLMFSLLASSVCFTISVFSCFCDSVQKEVVSIPSN